MFTYLLINLISVSFPLAFSGSKRFGFGSRLKQAWLAVALSAIPFILWDILFTHLGVWGFNEKYILGYHFFNLPLEEVLFFLAIPFACLFIYQQFLRMNLRPLPDGLTTLIWAFLGLAFLMLALFNLDKIYTLSVGILAGGAAAFLAWFRPRYSRPLMLALIFQYLPFLLVNGILTYLPVVIYDGEAFMGYRIGTIPLEDSLYSFVMLVGPVAIYEFLGKRSSK
jgi:lycopene cyclase domain-containing protein